MTEGFQSISTRTIQKSRSREQKKMSSTDSGVPNIEKLSNDNYGIWVMKMEAVLKLKGVWPAMLDGFSLADAATAEGL